MSDPNTPGAVPPPPTPPSMGSPTPPMGTPRPTEAFPAVEPTAQMPTTGVDQGAGTPPTQPPDTGFDGPYGEPEPEDQGPWYKQPLALALMFLVLLGLGALLAVFLLGGDDDDAAEDNSSLLTIEVTDQNGEPIDTGFLASVSGPAGSEAAYQWVLPADAVPGELAGASSGSQGRVAFEWEIDTDTISPDTWEATVSLLQALPEGASPASALVECVLRRDGDPDTIVTMSVEVIDDDASDRQFASFLFPNYQFSVGDTVTCRVVTDLALGTDTTSVPETSTAPSTSVADTTTTSPATTTTTPAATTTQATTTTTATTVPEDTLWDVIVADPDLSALAALIELADLDGELDDPNATLTMLAPTNQAIAAAVGAPGAPDFSDPDVVEAVLLTHLNDTEELSSAELLALDPPEFTVVNPGPHAIDDGASPPTVGGAELDPVDLDASNGVLHVIDQVLLPVTLP